MCDTSIRPKLIPTIRTAINAIVSTRKPFTAYDVTVEARRHTVTQFRHAEVREFIHNELSAKFGLSRRQHEAYNAFEYYHATVPTQVVTPTGIYGIKPDNSSQAGRKYWNVRNSRGQFEKRG